MASAKESSISVLDGDVDGGCAAFIAHNRKDFGDGLREVRHLLDQSRWARDLLWLEVDKSRKVHREVQRALAAGATRIIVWGGDGSVQQAIDALRDTDPEVVTLAVMPAGTANLFATNLGIPKDFDQAYQVAIGRHSRRIDVGMVNGECFGVMAGTGLDALMIRQASKGLKDRIGRLAYVWTGVSNIHHAANNVTVKIDGEGWFDGAASCVLLGNVGTLIGGVQVFEHADPTDGLLEVGVVSAESLLEWARLLGRTIVSKPERSPLLTSTCGRKITVKMKDKRRYELDGGDRPKTRKLKVRVRPGAISVCVPEASDADATSIASEA